MKFQRFMCLFGLHDWTPWITGKVRMTSYETLQAYEHAGQKRNCEACNFEELRLIE